MADSGGPLDQKHIEGLLTIAEGQVKFAITDALRHACAHLGVDYDHASIGVVLEELKDRLGKLLEGGPRDF